MPKLNIVWRPSQPALSSPRTQRRLLAAGSRLYRTLQRPDVFFWAEDPEGSTGPAPRNAGGRGKAARPSGQFQAQRTPAQPTRCRPRENVPAVDAPAEVFNQWLSNLYQRPRR